VLLGDPPDTPSANEDGKDSVGSSIREKSEVQKDKADGVEFLDMSTLSSTDRR
jgi:hypothetical protein